MFKRLTSALLSIALSGAAWATTYNYTGPTYNFVGAPYTTSMSITGSFTTASPLPANMPITDIGPLGSNLVTAWSFNDGINSYDQTNSVVFPPAGLTFRIGTDASGNITSFAIQLEKPLPPHIVTQLMSAITLTTIGGNQSQGLNATPCLTLSGNVCASMAAASQFGDSTGSGSFAPAAVVAPTLTKAFGAGSITQNSSTSLTFNVNNPNAVASLSGIGFTDTLPAGLVVSTPNGLTGSCGGGTITATAGSGSVSLATATLAGSGSCSFSVNVTGVALGTQSNVTGAITSTEGGTGGTASASVDVTSAPPPPPSPPAVPVPALQELALALLALLVGAIAFAFLRRRTS